MSKSTGGTRRSPLYFALLLALVCGVIAVAAWSAGSSPVMASILNVAGTPSPAAHSQMWAQVEIPKPTYTPSPTPTPSPIPTEMPEATATPVVMLAEIVPDTPIPDYTDPAIAGAPPAPEYAGNQYILVDISEQHLYAYEGGDLAFSFVASTGMNNATRIGMFSVLEKIPNAYGATWNIWMPNWLGIYWSGSLQNGIHALPILSNGAQLWAGYLGTPISYGCVVLGEYESQLLYDWAEIGTPVEIRW